MKNQFEKIFRTLQSLTLSKREKEEMKENLIQHMEAQPTPYIQSQQSVSIFNILWARPAMVVAALVFVIGGISYAAEGSLPGDFLYVVKTELNENVRGAVATSPQAKVEWETQIAKRRIDEVSALISEDRLTPEIEKKLTNEIKGAAGNIMQALDALEGEGAVTSEDYSRHKDIIRGARSSFADGMTLLEEDIKGGESELLESVSTAIGDLDGAIMMTEALISEAIEQRRLKEKIEVKEVGPPTSIPTVPDLEWVEPDKEAKIPIEDPAPEYNPDEFPQ
jgi:hypothetical protein